MIFKLTTKPHYPYKARLDSILLFRTAALEAAYIHFDRIDVNLLLTAYALDPKNRLKYLTNASLLLVERVVAQTLIDMGNVDTIVAAVVEEFRRYKTILHREEVNATGIVAWWEEQNLPLLCQVAVRMPACHASSANTERIFSALKGIVTNSRNRLNLDTIFDLITIRVANLSRRARKDRVEAQEAPQATQETIEAFEDDVAMLPLESVVSRRPRVPVTGLESSLQSISGYEKFKKLIDFSLTSIADIDQVLEAPVEVSSQVRVKEALRRLRCL